MWFAKKNKEENETNKTVQEETAVEEPKTEEEEPVEEKPIEEWIWVNGYKATEKDMKCQDYQYVMGEQHDMPEDAEIKECKSGFHFCKKLNDVFRYYGIGRNNRFFRVRALVRKEDYERYGKYTKEYEEYLKNRAQYSMFSHFYGNEYVDKLVAKSIIFESELTPDEILKDRITLGDPMWTDEYKKLALEVGIDDAITRIQTDNLVELGYSLPFAQFVIDSRKYDRALAVAAQPDLSMDMRCWLIFK